MQSGLHVTSKSKSWYNKLALRTDKSNDASIYSSTVVAYVACIYIHDTRSRNCHQSFVAFIYLDTPVKILWHLSVHASLVAFDHICMYTH